MSTSPFAYMATALATHATDAPPPVKHGRGADTRAGAMLEALRTGPRLAHELATAAGVSSALVIPLLKHHLAKGRVHRRWDERGRRLYELNLAFEADLQDRLAAAVQLLQLHGYVVRTPDEQEDAPCEH